MPHLARILVTMGDVAGIGPEIIAKAWPELTTIARPVVVGDPDCLRRALHSISGRATVRPADREPTVDNIPCLVGSDVDVSTAPIGRVSAAAGKAAADYLCTAIDRTLAGDADGIVTAPLHKEGLKAAGVDYPGHTEILAQRTGTRRYAMALYCDNLSVIHVTLHRALRDVFTYLTIESVLEKIELLSGWLTALLERQPHVAVAALNPHASDGGLFGDEEFTIIAPAIAEAKRHGINVSGPWPCDSLFVRARSQMCDGVVVMYHDQGHIAMKLLGIEKLVNVTIGLPFIRTSVAHGTAYDIAGQGIADHSSLVEAARLAVRLAAK